MDNYQIYKTQFIKILDEKNNSIYDTEQEYINLRLFFKYTLKNLKFVSFIENNNCQNIQLTNVDKVFVEEMVNKCLEHNQYNVEKYSLNDIKKVIVHSIDIINKHILEEIVFLSNIQNSLQTENIYKLMNVQEYREKICQKN